MAAELERELGARARLIEGRNGVFDVRLDGDLVFSKHRVGRFPDEGEVLAAIRGKG